MTTMTNLDTRKVSVPCGTGNHGRCLGTVYVYPPEDGKRMAECECPVTDCGHGSDVEKAKRSRG